MFQAIFALLLLALPFAGYGATCEELSSVSLPNGTVTSARVVESSKFVPPPPPQNVGAFGGAPARVSDLPAFCRVTATLNPSNDSDIQAEFWMPVSAWNGRLQPTAACGREPRRPRQTMVTKAAARVSLSGIRKSSKTSPSVQDI